MKILKKRHYKKIISYLFFYFVSTEYFYYKQVNKTSIYFNNFINIYHLLIDKRMLKIIGSRIWCTKIPFGFHQNLSKMYENILELKFSVTSKKFR